MKMSVVPYVSLLLTASFLLALTYAPTVEACHARECYNERYVAGGASVLGADVAPPVVCVLEPCGDGGVYVGGAYTDAHAEWNAVVVKIVDGAFGTKGALGLCGTTAEDDCVGYADVVCGTNFIAFQNVTFTGVRSFTPHFAVTVDLEACGATTGVVQAFFDDGYIE